MITMDLLSNGSSSGAPLQIREIVDYLLAFMLKTDPEIEYSLEEVIRGIISARLLALYESTVPVPRKFRKLFLVDPEKVP